MSAKCKCYLEEYNYAGDIGRCNGTRERDACDCGGDKAKCDFYPEVSWNLQSKIV